MGYAANWPDDTRQGGAVLVLLFSRSFSGGSVSRIETCVASGPSRTCSHGEEAPSRRMSSGWTYRHRQRCRSDRVQRPFSARVKVSLAGADRGLEFASGHQLDPISAELIPANMIGRILDDSDLPEPAPAVWMRDLCPGPFGFVLVHLDDRLRPFSEVFTAYCY
jgi:hypothetical protein